MSRIKRTPADMGQAGASNVDASAGNRDRHVCRSHGISLVSSSCAVGERASSEHRDFKSVVGRAAAKEGRLEDSADHANCQVEIA